MQETRVWFLGWEVPLEKGMAIHSSILALQYSCLENSMHREAWWATVHCVTKNWTQLSNWAYTRAPNESGGQFVSGVSHSEIESSGAIPGHAPCHGGENQRQETEPWHHLSPCVAHISYILTKPISFFFLGLISQPPLPLGGVMYWVITDRMRPEVT